MSDYNEEARRTRRAMLNSDYDPIEMRQLLATMDAVGPGPQTRKMGHATFAIKTEMRDGRAKTFAFVAQKTMYSGNAAAFLNRCF